MNDSTLPAGDARIAFIGAGNMARALFGGMIAQGWEPNRIAVADPNAEALEAAGKQGVTTCNDNLQAVSDAAVVVLAVKPQVLKRVLQEMAPALTRHKPLLISIAAGIDLAALQRWAGDNVPIVRCMPNTPALVQTGATAMFAGIGVSDANKVTSEKVLGAVGIALWLEHEAQLDAVTAVSGSGPAYFFLVMEAMTAAGQELGLPLDAASRLTVQTALGAARMARDSDVDVSELRRRVTSPGGTTEQAIAQFEQSGLAALFSRAMERCAARSQELARELGED